MCTWSGCLNKFSAQERANVGFLVRVVYVTCVPQRRFSPEIRAGSEWLWRASPGPWCSSDKAFLMRSSRLPARAEALGSLDDKSGVDVVDSSIAGAAIQALSRPGAASSSVNRSRATRSRYELHKGSAVEIRCVLHLPATFFLPHFSATSLLAGSCLY